MRNTTRPEAGTGNVRNGTRAKTVLDRGTSGHVEIDVPRDRAGDVRTADRASKRQRRLNGVDEIVLSLYAKGLTTGRDLRPFR